MATMTRLAGRLLKSALAAPAGPLCRAVTTRAVAERAQLPHGSVSYHFHRKQELLTEAALHAFQQAIPADRFAAPATVEDLIALIAAELDPHAIDPVLSRLMLEATRS
jgi:AcrR family transcriptional regulator